MRLTAILLALFCFMNACKVEDISEDLIPFDYIPLEGEIKENLTLEKRDNIKFYLLKGYVRVTDGATLTIEEGVVIKGDVNYYSTKDEDEDENKRPGTLIIDKGSKIIAKGTAQAPIIFESNEGGKAWGGIVIIGEAPTNRNADRKAEDDDLLTPSGYGGDKPLDDSGVLSHIVILNAGAQVKDVPKEDDTRELNGIAFYGVGSGTTVDNIFVYDCSDDGIEMFGGTVNVKKAVVVDSKDDCFDWTEGWQGKGQFWVGQYCTESDKDQHGIEGANEGGNAPDKSDFFSNPTIFNFTLIGNKKGKYALSFDGKTKGKLYNGIISDFKEGPITGPLSNVTIENNVFFPQHSIEAGLPMSNYFIQEITLSDNPFDQNALGCEGLSFLVKGESRQQLGADGYVSVAPPSNDNFFENIIGLGAVPNENDKWYSWMEKYVPK